MLERAGAGLALAALLLPVAAHGFVSTANRWMADTFCYAYIVHIGGMRPALEYWRRDWTGRYGFNFAESASGLIGPALTRWLPSIYLALWFVAAAWLAHEVLWQAGGEARPAPRWRPWLASALVLFVTLTSIPNIPQSLYWTDGLHNYVPPLVVGTVAAAVVARAARTKGASANRWLVQAVAALACLGLALLAGGFTEVYTAMQGALVAGLILMAMVSRPLRGALPSLLAALAGTAVAAAIVASAPGNAIRATQLPPPLPLARVPFHALENAGIFAAQAFARAPLSLAGAAALAGLAGFALGGDRSRGRIAARCLVWIPLITGGVMLVGFAVPAYAFAGGPPPGRGIIVPMYFLVWAIVAECLAAGVWLRVGGLGQGADLETRLWRGAIGLLAMVLFVNAIWVAVRTVMTYGRYAAYAAAWDARDADIRAALGLGAERLAVVPLANVFGLEEVGGDPRHWVNGCVGGYYGLDLVANVPAAPPDGAALAAMRPLDAQLGNVARVEGYTLAGDPARAGETLVVTVFWRPLAATARPLTVFVHVYDPALGSQAQYDSQPLGGTYPTTQWIFGSLFAETYTLTVPPDMPAGTRPAVVVGLYELETGERQPASGANADEVLNWVRLD